ncbi:hypothetical protein HG536_0A06140 [Torulaspora globosa]|uniref:non-specific serine/threonine protein kinase n=1 Tax=Torulaspora globosa TaxID=48254 RepID=A0A7G3ZBB3_9SACH|nr:uncharacterized protein HG536_0A06140 [Torulaspora globosa]QLL30799.1 hypothetical protein HG536_0A06140 [Torulaspora globosa]
MCSLPTCKRSPQDFVFKQELGRGSYSTVFKAIDRSDAGRVYAIKVCSKQHIIKEGKVKYVTIEKNTLSLLKRARHPGIVKLHSTFHDEKNLYFVLEYAAGGELLSLLHRMGTFSEAWARHFICQLIDAVEFIHSQGVIHRDLKPENLLLSSEGRLMITDFGTATTAGGSECSSFVGTAEYVCPELLLQNRCDFSSDVWALGCMIYQFVQGKPPFRGDNELQTFEKTVALDYPWNHPSTTPKTVNPLIVRLTRRILVVDPASRPSLPEIKLDKWLETVDWDNKELLWRGIWQIQQPVSRPNRQMVLCNRQLHVIDTPLRNIPVTKQKKKKPAKISNTTSSIVEWRKRLGISVSDSLVQPEITPPSQPVAASRASSPAFGKPTPSLPRVNTRNANGTTKGKISTPPSSASPIDMPDNSIGDEILAQDSLVLKKGCVNIFEIPYRLDGPDMSLKTYSKVDNELITQLVLRHELELKSRAPSFLTLFKDGTLSYRSDSSSKHIINIGDPNLSMYDFDFNEKERTGFLILEKYKVKIWFISIPDRPASMAPGTSKNSDEEWVACFFRARQLMEEQKALNDKFREVSIGKKAGQTQPSRPSGSERPAKPRVARSPRVASSPAFGSSASTQRKASVTRSPITSPTLGHSPTMKKYAAPQNMVISSSRYEVLNSLRVSTAKDDASSGASAAFKSLQKKSFE